MTQLATLYMKKKAELSKYAK